MVFGSPSFEGVCGGFLRAYFNGRMKVSKTLDLGSNPSARAE